jgi:Flp pilus assembly protein TadB
VFGLSLLISLQKFRTATCSTWSIETPSAMNMSVKAFWALFLFLFLFLFFLKVAFASLQTILNTKTVPKGDSFLSLL